jgi:hypothetical protein
LRVARFASPDEEEKYTVTRIANAIDYLAAKLGPIQGRVPVAVNAPPAVKAVRRALGAKSLSAIRVSVTDGKLNLGGIELGVLPALAKALARLDPKKLGG